MHEDPRKVGTIYGTPSATAFQVAVSDPELKRLDYIEVAHGDHRVLGRVETIIHDSGVSLEEALSGSAKGSDRLSASVSVLGFQDERGRTQFPRTPFRSGVDVFLAPDDVVTAVLGLKASAEGGAYLGHVKGLSTPVHLSINSLVQKHVSVLAKTGAGKSYTVAVLLEEFAKARVPLVILDPHGEYSSLAHANMESADLDAMVRFGVKPKAFDRQVVEYSPDTTLNPDAKGLLLEAMNLEARQILDLLPVKVSGSQQGLIYQGIREVKEQLPAYTLRDIIDAVGQAKSASKWNVMNALEALESTGVFSVRGTPITDLVKPAQVTIINLKGIAPDVQEVVAARLLDQLWDARKRGEIPAHMVVVEEAHNFCPERGVGNAVSGAIIRTVASEGRKFGMGLLVVTQRPAKVDKNVVSQCNTQIVLKVTNPNDLKAIIASVEGITSEAADEVQRLPVGVALVAGGGLTQPIYVEVRPRQSQHGGRSIDVLAKATSETDEITAPRTIAQPAAKPRIERAIPPPAAPMAEAASIRPRKTARVRDEPPAIEPDVPAPRPVAEAPPAPRRPERMAPEPSRPPTRREFEPMEPPKAAARAVEREAEFEARRPAPGAPPTRRPEPSPYPGRTPDPTPTRRAPPPQPPPRAPGPRRAPEANPEPPALSGRVTKAQLADIHRVAKRIGLVEGNDPGHGVQVVENIARQRGQDPRELLAHYLAIAQSACLDPTPACIRCPLRESCNYHRTMESERRKTRSMIRRLWQR